MSASDAGTEYGLSLGDRAFIDQYIDHQIGPAATRVHEPEYVIVTVGEPLADIDKLEDGLEDFGFAVWDQSDGRVTRLTIFKVGAAAPDISKTTPAHALTQMGALAATRLLPELYRRRYYDEFVSELHACGRTTTVAYVFRQIVRSPLLRYRLTHPVKVPDRP